VIERKPLTWFLVITFAISWPLFLIPLAFHDADAVTRQLLTTGLWALAMWGPGIAAIVTTALVTKQPWRTLKLNRLGPKRYYLWAWFLPPVLSVLTGLFTILLGIGKLDTDFTAIREAMRQAPSGSAIDPAIVVALQIVFALSLAPFINVLFALGEELGWRGFLLPRLMPLGQWKAILFSGVIWGIWHAPAIVQGLNYPGYPVAGVFMMIVFCLLLGTILAWLYLNTQSPWAAALGHGAINASAGLPVLFLAEGFDMALGGTLASVAGWIGLTLFVGWLIFSRRLPVKPEAGEEPVKA